jgi:thiol-disulfide isomerase/thioredoxin
LLAGAAGLASQASAATPGEIAIGGVLPDVTMKGLIGPARNLGVYRGKPLLINVWASWCGPCRQEMGSLELLNRRFGGQQFNIIGISTDDYEDRALGFLRQSNTTFNNFLDKNLVLENLLGADHLPLTLLVDARGRVLSKVYGSRQWDSPESLKMMEQMLKIKL